MGAAYNHGAKTMQKIMDKAKPVARQGRKATGLIEIAGLPFTSEPSCLLRGFSVFLFYN